MSAPGKRDLSIDGVEITLLEAAANGGFESALAVVLAALESRSAEPDELLHFRVLFFDLALVANASLRACLSCAVDLVATALETGESGWQPILLADRRTEIERLARESDDGLDLLELLAYAPDGGVHQFAVSQLISVGMRALEHGDDSRRIERLLHEVGATPEAYRLEELRKHRTATAHPRGGRALPESFEPRYRVIALAGGHARMRRTAASLLEPYGITVVPIPSSREAVRREHDILQVLHGCDAVVLVVRQITHSTSDQVRKISERLGIPVIFSNAVSALALERQLIDPEKPARSV